MKKALVFSTFALLAGAVGAGCSSDICSRKSPCPNDTPATQAQIDQCKANEKAYSGDPCYGDFMSYANCSADNTVCGGDGKTDGTLTGNKVKTACSNQIASATACCAKNASSSLCKGG